MKNWKRGILGVALSFMILFTALGYAALTDTLIIGGTLNASEPEKLYITNITPQEGSPSASITGYTSVKANITEAGTTAVYEITVKNNTNDIYVYTGTELSDVYADVQLTITESTDATVTDKNKLPANAGVGYSGTVVQPGETFTFYSTYTLTDDLSTAEGILVNYSFVLPKYKIEYINDKVTHDIRYVYDNSIAIDTDNPTAKKAVEDQMGTGYTVIGWMNAGSTHLTDIPKDNDEDVKLYPVFQDIFTASFVELDGTIIDWDTFTTTNYQNIKDMGDKTTPRTVDNCVFDYWEVHVTKNGTTTTTALSAYTFADEVDITIYPVYTYMGDVNLVPVDTDGDGMTNEYHVAGYSKPEGQAMVVIPESVMGIPVTAIQDGAFSSYSGIHSVVIPTSVTSIGNEAFANKLTIGESGQETITIYYAGSKAQWDSVTTADDTYAGLGASSRVFFLNGTDKVDVNEGYLQGNRGTLGLSSLTWDDETVTQTIIDEYLDYCDCKISTEGDTAHIYVDAAGNILGRNEAGTPVNSAGVVINHAIIKEATWPWESDEYGLTDGSTTTYKRYRPDRQYWIEYSTWTVTYDANGGTCVTAYATGPVGTSTILPTPTRDGYTFAGWSDGTNTYAAGATYTPTADVTLTALWT